MTATTATRLLPTSFAQRRLWMLDQIGETGSAYHLVTALRLHGPVGVTALRQALAAVADRHEALRTTFTVVDGEPFQQVATELSPELAVREVGGEAAAREAVEQEIARPFALTTGPLVRVALLRLGENDHVLTVVCHHIVCDGWSMALVVDELAALYAGAELEPATQFGEFAVRQREKLAGDRLRTELDHWRDRLTGAPELLALPTTHPRAATQGFAGATHRTPLDAELWAEVRAAAVRTRVTPYILLLSAYAVLLSRLTGSRDVVIGSPSAGRSGASLGPVVGMFVNTMPIRVELAADPTFAEVLKHVRHAVLDAVAHQDVPLDRIVADLVRHRAGGHDPLFQTMFAVQQPAPAPEFAGLAAEIFPVPTASVFTDLWLEIRPDADGADCALHYRTELFDAADIERTARRFLTVLRTALAEPGTPLSRFELSDEGERARILNEWSRGGDAHPWTEPVHELIQRQALATPDATAVVFKDEQLSYNGLVRRAGTLARRLASHGAGRDTVVALCLDRGLELVTSVVGVMAAGSAYLPLSPEDPPARIDAVLRATGASLVLATKDTAPDTTGVPVLLVDELGDDGVEAPMAQRAVDPADLAYVISTSGSTGPPKPVAVPHRGLANRIANQRRAHPLAADDRVLHKTPTTFDVSVWELLWPLTTGAALVVAEPGGHRDPAYLVDLIEREAVTTVHFVPPMLEAFLGEPDLHRCGSLRRVLCSGQALPAALRDRCLLLLPVRLINLYGPTEASIEVTGWECRAADGPRVPIGRPLAGVETYVLDAELRPVPPGVTGELFLGGVALARGYLGLAAATAERFVPHPFARRPGQRLYRTGDLVRWRPDGALDYLGRNDQQVKVRGVRVELGEIENALREHPEVRDAAVTATERGLTAYLVPRGDGDPAGPVRERLRARLPGYLMPSRFVVLPRLPLGRSGKVDRAALPEPALAEAARAEPRDELERTLVGIWLRVLDRASVGPDEDFFAIGGDSLKGIQVVHRAREAGLRLSVGDIFRNPTVEDLAAHLRSAR
ncbi:amino acid adenylation domain-containing protein [Amycolatopsis sp. NBC_00345]|uniref:amino acid adenylation domain-containing protein n=1 Tax=Amycolatopsis sp. NBC_00345 TaxID=2975955 RepID=UPI002E26D8AE